MRSVKKIFSQYFAGSDCQECFSWGDCLLDNSSNMMAVVDAALNVTYFNKAFADGFFINLGHDKKYHLEAFIGKRKIGIFQENLAKAFDGGNLNFIDNFFFENKKFCYKIILTPVTGVNQCVRYVIINVLDISDLMLTQDNLKEELAYSEYVFKRNPAMIIGFDLAGNILNVNPKACAVTGYSASELIGRNWWKVFSPGNEEEGYRKLVSAFRTQLELDGYEMPLLTKDGQTRIIKWSSLNRYDENVSVKEIIGFGIDVTDQKTLFSQLEAAKYEAEEANRAKSDFLANMSHEIRTPMNGVIGTADLLAQTNLTQKQKNYLKIIKSSGRTLLEIVNEILDYSKIDAGKFEFAQEPFFLRECIEETAALMHSLAQEKGLKFDLVIDSDLPDCVEGDSLRLRQILTNLIGNAIKFTSQGCVSLNVRFDKNDKSLIYFAVRDTGVGIQEEQRNKIFVPFSQIVQSKKDSKQVGTGLGLVITQYLVENMGGEIGFESEVDKGTTFWFTVLFGAVEPEVVKKLENKETLDVGAPVKFDANILVVEDVLTNQFVITDMLENLGCHVDIASNGKEGFEAVQSKTYDLVLMDCQMPVMDGFESTHAIRALGYDDLIIVALTANALRGDHEKCIAAGMNDFLSKPVEQGAVVRILKTYLKGHEKYAVG